jgi:hypothetical protein
MPEFPGRHRIRLRPEPAARRARLPLGARERRIGGVVREVPRQAGLHELEPGVAPLEHDPSDRAPIAIGFPDLDRHDLPEDQVGEEDPRVPAVVLPAFR